MPDNSIDGFLRLLKRSKLLSAQQLKALRADLKSGSRQVRPDACARRLASSGLITEWQANMLLQDQTGFVLDKYIMLEPVGRGGMGTVFRAKDSVLGREVAVKVMAKKYTENEKLVGRFLREMQAAAAIDSPHVVRAVDAGRVGDTYYLVMEFVEGDNLEQLLNRVGAVPVSDACELGRQAAIGLQHAHEKGMVHRDIKPANLILTWDEDEQPVVKVFDLGLVRLAQQIGDDGVTRPGQVMGTVDYMSPEQGWNTKQVDIRSDIYSLGCTLFRLITGRIPFTGENPLQVLMARCSTDAPPVSRYVRGIPDGFDDLMKHIMARDPAQRMQTPIEVANALARFAHRPTRESLESLAADHEFASANTIADEGGNDTPADVSFEQFLNELSTDTATSIFGPDATASRSTASQSATATRPAAVSRVNIQRASRGVSGSVLAIGALSVALIVLVVATLMRDDDATVVLTENRGRESDSADGSQNAGLYLASVPNQKVRAGQEVRFTVRPESLEERQSSVTYTIEDGAPAGAKLDPTSGDFTWTPTPEHAPGVFDVVIAARRRDSDESERKTVRISVNDDGPAVELAAVSNQQVEAGKQLRLQLGIKASARPPDDIQFALSPDCPPDIRLDRQSGLLIWTPGESRIGRHTIAISLVRDGQPLDSKSFDVLVMKGEMLPRLADVNDRNVVAGQTLSINVRTENDELPSIPYTFRLADGAPDGLAINALTGAIEWTPGRDVTGTFPVAVLLEAEGRSGKLTERVEFDVEVTAATPPPAVAKSEKPTEDEIAKADKQVREVFRRDISQARSTAARRQLAVKLHSRARVQKDAATRVALLRIALDAATRGRNYVTAFEIIDLISATLGSDNSSEKLAAFESVRMKDLTPLEKDILAEEAVSVALASARRDRNSVVRDALEFARTLARAQKDTELVEGLRQAQDFAVRLAKAGEDGEESAPLLKSELVELLERRSFEPLFVAPDRIAFVSHSNRDLKDLGESLWQVADGAVTLECEAQDALTGFIDRSKQVTSFTLRAKISTDSTTGFLYFGAPASGAFNGFQLQLSPHDFLQIRRSGGGDVLVRPRGTVKRSDGEWDYLELRVEGRRVAVRLNGQPVLQSQLPNEPDGLFGLDAFLAFGNPTTRLRLEKVRIR